VTLDPAIVLIARLAIGCLLLYAATHKLRDMLAFRLSLGAYRLLPETIVTPAAYLLVLVEILLGLACLAMWRMGYLGAMALLAAYTIAILINLSRGLDSIDCGCGGPPQPLSYALVLRNGLLLIVGAVAASDSAMRSLGWLDAMIIAMAISVLAFLFGAANLLLVARTRFREEEV